MAEKTSEQELNTLKDAIASLREEIAALAAGTKKIAESKAAESHAEGDHETTQQESSTNGEKGSCAWSDFQHKLDEAWTQKEKFLKDLAAEIERHPLVGVIAAFGIGFIIARLWFGGRKL